MMDIHPLVNLSGSRFFQKIIIIIFFLPVTLLFAQEEIGLNPPSIKWRQIVTPAGRIIFPKGFDSTAFLISAYMNYQREHDSSLVGKRITRRIPVILQNQSTLPAGFSTPAPWRNEYYLTPPQNLFLGPVLWKQAMPLHEYRHTQQFYMANHGYTWLYKILMGQTGLLLNTLMTQPLWLREGDAVTTETIFTGGGRGRLPSFHMEYRAMRLAGYHYDYEKAHYSSYRNFIPNPYRIGYYMITKARRDYGNNIWEKILNDAYSREGFFYPISRSMKKNLGYNSKKFYNRTVEELDSIWSITDKSIHFTPSVQINKTESKVYTNYRFPQFIGQDSILVLKSAFNLINTYYIIKPDGSEKKLFSPGLYTDDHITTVVEGEKFVWAESGFHPRYINKDFSVIKIHNLETGKTKKLSHRSRYFSPAISKDGTKVAVVEMTKEDKYSIHILNASNGKVIRRLDNDGNLFIAQPRWYSNNLDLICITLEQDGNAITKINSETGERTAILKTTRVPVSRPYPAGKYILFSGGYSGINNIYAADTVNGRIYQITSVRFGAFEPTVSADQKKLIYSEYTADGYRTMQIDFNTESWKEYTIPSITDINFHQNITTSEDKNIVDSITGSQSYKVKKYNAFFDGLFNFYGWMVIPNVPEYGLELYTQNIMSTLKGTVGAAYNTNEHSTRYYTRFTYAAFYPLIDFEYSYGNRHNGLVPDSSDVKTSYTQTWREQIISAGIRIPFRLTQGTHRTNMILGGRIENYKIDFLDTGDVKKIFRRDHFNSVRFSYMFSRLKLRAIQHVQSRWGQVFELEYKKAINTSPQRLYSNLLLYFPGFGRTHSFNIRASYKKESTINSYRYIDNFRMPRGYRTFPFEDIRLISFNYELPLFYPDLSLGPVAFIQRVRVNVFADIAKGSIVSYHQNLNSTGAELYTDLRLFRLFRMTAGVRYSYVKKPVNPGLDVIPFQFLITNFELAN